MGNNNDHVDHINVFNGLNTQKDRNSGSLSIYLESFINIFSTPSPSSELINDSDDESVLKETKNENQESEFKRCKAS